MMNNKNGQASFTLVLIPAFLFVSHLSLYSFVSQVINWVLVIAGLLFGIIAVKNPSSSSDRSFGIVGIVLGSAMILFLGWALLAVSSFS
jgi:hypothetical protein